MLPPAKHPHPKWLADAIFYEIYPQSFVDSNGDGIGDIPGITLKLDYIKDLGCNAIWLNPCFDSPFKDAGYDVRDYKKVASRYGTNDDLIALFDAAHRRDMHVILDLVPGHTSEEHEWFHRSCKVERNNYSDRYIWTDSWISGGDGLPFIGGESPRNGTYILNFFKCQPALNYGFAHPERSWQKPALGPDAKATCDAMVDVILVGVVLGIASARLYYVAMAPYNYDTIWDVLAVRDGGLAIYGGIIGAFVFGGLACKWRGVPVLPMFDLTAMGFLLGQGCGRWGNFFNQEAFGCNTTLPWGMYSETTRAYLMSSTVTVPKGVVIDPNLPVHPTFLYESIWCFVGFFLLFRYIKKRKFNGDITLRYLIWYGAGRFWIEGLRTDSLMLVPSIGLRASQLVAGIAVVAGIAAEVYFTRKCKGKPLLVPLALNAENKAAQKKLDGPISFAGKDTQLLASSPRKLFLEKTEAYNAQVKAAIEQAGQKKA